MQDLQWKGCQEETELPLERLRLQTDDGISLDVGFARSDEHGATMVFVPCTLGDACSEFYSVPVRELTDRGYSVLLYNPRGHGRSDGTIDPNTVAKDLAFVLESLGRQSNPVAAVGHSTGANWLIRAAWHDKLYERLYLVSPVLHTRRSLLFMYERNTIAAFVNLLARDIENNEDVYKLLERQDWLFDDPVTSSWADGLNGPTAEELSPGVPSIANFLVNMFLPGSDMEGKLHDLSKQRKLFVLLPHTDIWFPVDKTIQICDQAGIPYFQYCADGADHMLRELWPDVWKKVLGWL